MRVGGARLLLFLRAAEFYSSNLIIDVRLHFCHAARMHVGACADPHLTACNARPVPCRRTDDVASTLQEELELNREALSEAEFLKSSLPAAFIVLF